MEADVRRPAVAGRFYSRDPEQLARDVEALLAGPSSAPPSAPQPAKLLVAPHAGYIYSGAIAGAVYRLTRIPSRVVVLCPNHTGRGARRSIWASGTWRLPTGELSIDVELAELMRELAGLDADREAHSSEHAIEVQLPFVRALRPDARIVPICLSVLPVADCIEIGEALATAIRQIGSDDVLLIASTDMSHYVPADVAAELDRLALQRVISLDPVGLYRVVTRHDISMCGFVPTTVALAAARALSAERAELVRYGNSGEVSGDLARVVGYASLRVR
jgi:AmmeMemoRadiSam system protein B